MLACFFISLQSETHAGWMADCSTIRVAVAVDVPRHTHKNERARTSMLIELGTSPIIIVSERIGLELSAGRIFMVMTRATYKQHHTHTEQQIKTIAQCTQHKSFSMHSMAYAVLRCNYSSGIQIAQRVLYAMCGGGSIKIPLRPLALTGGASFAQSMQ